MTNKNAHFAAVTVTFAILALVGAVLTGCDSAEMPRQDVVQGFYSTDDGKTWFPDDMKKIPPFTKDGKEAVRAQVYRCPDGKLFAAWLERYTPQSKKQLEAALNAPKDGPPALPTSAVETEVKLPGEGAWIKNTDPRAAAIMKAKCPGGGEPEVVNP